MIQLSPAKKPTESKKAAQTHFRVAEKDLPALEFRGELISNPDQLELQVEEFFTGAHRNMEFKDEFRSRGQQFDLNPGEGLHFPVAAPHYVENGPKVSVSFSITFQTEDSADRQTLHRFNRNLRKIGLKPSNVGNNPKVDDRKLAFLRMMRKAKRLVKK